MITRIAATVLGIVLVAGTAHPRLAPSPHDFTKAQCPDCHARSPERGKPGTLVMKAPIPYLCTRCHHDMEDTLSHPVEVVPVRAAVPEDFPLAWNGKMTCSTCHDIHAPSPATPAGARAFLRRPVVGPALCSACHGSGKGGGYGPKIGRAHMVYRQEGRGMSLDPVSRVCLSCHDTGRGRNSPNTAGSWEHGIPLSRFDPRGSHPLGVDYAQAQARYGGLKPAGALNPSIKLIDGKVGCSSCHSPSSQKRKQLVMSNTGNRLCMACHTR